MTTSRASRASLEAAYRAARYLLPGPPALSLAIDRAEPGLDALLARHGVATAAVITAANPGSQPRSEAENAAAHQQLLARLAQRGLRTIPSTGRDPAGLWPDEAGALVLGVGAPEAASIARAFGQNALVWCARGAPPRLVWTDPED